MGLVDHLIALLNSAALLVVSSSYIYMLSKLRWNHPMVIQRLWFANAALFGVEALADLMWIFLPDAPESAIQVTHWITAIASVAMACLMWSAMPTIRRYSGPDKVEERVNAARERAESEATTRLRGSA